MYQTLIVDDREINRIELERMDVWGRSGGFVVSGRAGDGVEALDELGRSHYDLVITDIRMPRLDGIGLLEEIKRKDLCSLVALISEYGEFDYAQRGIRQGAFDYLVKPMEPRAIRSLLQRASDHLSSTGQTFPAYFNHEEESLLSLVGVDDAALPKAFTNFAGMLERLTPDEQRASYMVRKACAALTHAFFEHYAWLPLYVSEDRYKRMPEEIGRACADSCARILSELAELTGRFSLPGAPAIIRDVCAHVLSYPEADVSLNSVSARFGINHTYLSDLFRRKTGERFNSYVTAVKIARARYCLKHTDLMIGEISYDLGYNDHDYFNRLFKKYNDITPSAYRKSAKL
jgi:two-component system response regulator YesN